MPRSSKISPAPARQNAPEMLIATLGLASQVGTLTFDELFFKRKVPMRHVVWIHTNESNPKMQGPIANVRREVEEYYAQKCPDVTFEFVTIEGRDGHRPLDTKTEADAEAVMFTLHREICKWKDAGYTVHFSLSGGRKVISAFGLVAAQLTFGSDDDKCWHLMSEDLLAERELMHAEPQHEVILVPVPVLRWATWKDLAGRPLAEAIAQDPLHAQEIAAQLSESEVLRLRREFVDKRLENDDAKILEVLALYGWDNEEIDTHLYCSCKNVVTRIWHKYCQFAAEKRFTGDLNESRVNRARLVADFHLVFQARLRERQR